MFISHVRKETKEIQSNEEHSNGVAKLCEKFTSEFGFNCWGYIMGLLHDKGKEQALFQTRIKRKCELEDGIPPEAPHAYVGALVAKKIHPETYPFISWAVMCHHSGLYDYTYFEKLMTDKNIPKDIVIPNVDKQVNIPDILKEFDPKYCNHLERMLFSCLVDADFLDTERFMQPELSMLRGSNTKITELLPLLDLRIKKFNNQTPINTIRNEILQKSITSAESARGFYSMTVPTGGGKTLASIAWALRHAIFNGQRRIIIAIPYTSIIVQTAAILKEIFGEENVLEHHSNTTSQNGDERTKLATENWDYPIIVTTNVQLFESMYSNKSAHCRKLHNIVNSVIILDEVQTLPTSHLQPIIDALKAYCHCFRTSVLFTTASMPVLSKDAIKINGLQGIDKIKEIMPTEMNLQKRLKRVNIEFDKTPCTYQSLSERLLQEKKVLCILNTRKDAKEIFSLLPKEGKTIHLSRMMCPAHIIEKIKEIKQALRDENVKIIRVISTQLIEAGVDIDFPSVYRQKTGLDSILQAAGRCNREGLLQMAVTHVFSIENRTEAKTVTRQCQATDNVKTEDFQSNKAIEEYFNQLYSRVESFDVKDIEHYLNNPEEMMFESAAEKFHLIDSCGYDVVVNYDKSPELVSKLRKEGPSYKLMKKLSQYMVNLRDNDFNIMRSDGNIEEILDGIFFVNNPKQYDTDVGLITDNTWLEETYII